MERCEAVFRQVCWLTARSWPEVDGMGEEDEAAASRLGLTTATAAAAAAAANAQSVADDGDSSYGGVLTSDGGPVTA
jgi:hypothetical protein